MEWLFDNDRPIYIQLVEKLKISIVSGIYKPGERLPSVRDFALETKVNPNTVQRAFTELENIKIIYTERTNGKFVTEDVNLLEKIKEEIAKENYNKFMKSMKELRYTEEEIKEYILENKGDVK